MKPLACLILSLGVAVCGVFGLRQWPADRACGGLLMGQAALLAFLLGCVVFARKERRG